MSYKKKKAKKNIVNQLKRKLGLIKIVLLKKIKSLQKNSTMQQRQTTAMMKWLRDRAKIIRPNNLRINDWVESYIDGCVLSGQPIQILTQLCVAKDLEIRYQKQGNSFVPTKGEKRLFLEEIPEIIRAFKINNIGVSWSVTLNRSYLDGGRIDINLEGKYQKMVALLIEQSGVSEVILINWEDDFLGGRPTSDQKVQDNIFDFVSAGMFRIDLERHMGWVRNDTDMIQTDEEIENDLKFKIGCEAEEGKLLMSSESPFPNGQFILTPLELPERYVFFEILAPEFQKRIVPILKPYPWRLN